MDKMSIDFGYIAHLYGTDAKKEYLRNYEKMFAHLGPITIYLEEKQYEPIREPEIGRDWYHSYMQVHRRGIRARLANFVLALFGRTRKRT